MANNVRLIDVTKCMACKGCQVACKQWNQLPAVETEFTGSYENPADLDFVTWSRVKFNEHANNGEVKWYFNFFSCMHCTEAGCMEICPVDAISRTDTGAVIINHEECIACGACTGACPFEIPRGPEVDEKAYKCNFCLHRVAAGYATACSKACPSGAVTFGTADEKIAEAEARVAELQERGVANAQLYGVDELGGMGVIYVLADSPDMYGLPVSPTVSYTTHLWKVAMRPLKTLAMAGLVAGMLGSWYTFRREKVKKENEKAAK